MGAGYLMTESWKPGEGNRRVDQKRLWLHMVTVYQMQGVLRLLTWEDSWRKRSKRKMLMAKTTTWPETTLLVPEAEEHATVHLWLHLVEILYYINHDFIEEIVVLRPDGFWLPSFKRHLLRSTSPLIGSDLCKPQRPDAGSNLKQAAMKLPAGFERLHAQCVQSNTFADYISVFVVFLEERVDVLTFGTNIKERYAQVCIQ